MSADLGFLPAVRPVRGVGSGCLRRFRWIWRWIFGTASKSRTGRWSWSLPATDTV